MKDGRYERYDLLGDEVEEGYPKSFSGSARGLKHKSEFPWNDGIDAGAVWDDDEA